MLRGEVSRASSSQSDGQAEGAVWGDAVEGCDVVGGRGETEENVGGTGETTLDQDGADGPRGLYRVRGTTADGKVVTARIERQ